MTNRNNKERGIKMYQIKEDEVQSLLCKLRQIRQASGEVIAMLEHMRQLQSLGHDVEEYDPDDYLERWFTPTPITARRQREE